MDITITQIIYALVFVSILLAVEGIYLLTRGNDKREHTINRRMMRTNSSNKDQTELLLVRKKGQSGGFSGFILSAFPDMEGLLWAANINMRPSIVLISCGGLTVLTFFVLTLVGIPSLLITLFISMGFGFILPFLILKIRADRQRTKFSEQLPDAINLITRGLQAGHPVSVAFNLVAREMPDPIGGEFGAVVDEISFGRDREEALRDIGQRYPDPDFRFFLAAVEMQRETGGNLVGILDNLTKIIRERRHMKKKAWAVSAEGRLTLLIVGALPYLLGAYLFFTNPDFFLGSADHPSFWPLMIGAWVLWLLGVIWIWRMVNIKV